MRKRIVLACIALSAGVGFAVEQKTSAQTGLQVTFGSQGVQQIRYRGVILENLSQTPSDAFHIWHMKMTDLRGNAKTDGQYGWGETNNGRQWDTASQTWTYSFTWGKIQAQFQQTGDTLNVNVVETNFASSDVILDGASIFPFVLHFPALPANFINASYPQLSYNTTGPSALGADYGQGLVAAVVPSADKPLYSGFLPAGTSNAYTPLISTTTPDGLATFQPHLDRPVLPGHTDSFTVSLRFAASGIPVASLASDAYRSWAQTWPALLHWADRRIIGSAYLASSPSGDPSKPAGFPNNPRRYFNDARAEDFDVRTSAGLAAFQHRILDQATAIVGNLQRMNAQGVITWDIEGEEYPQETSYVCSPDQIAAVAPEMESIVSDASSPSRGMKLDDAYFKIIRDAGYRVGVCIRPQQFTKNSDETAGQKYLPDTQVAAQLIRKMKYAHDRWGVTLFYLDSTVETNGATLDASLFQQAAAALPDSLLIPEESTPNFYAYAAPFKTFLFHGDIGTDPATYNFYPRAFSVNMVNDVDAGKLAAARSQLTNAVRRGDILVVHADYWQDNNAMVMKIYSDAGAGTTSSSSEITSPVSPPVPDTLSSAASAPIVTPQRSDNPEIAVTYPADESAISGSVVISGQTAAALDSAGSYLTVDGIEVGTRRIVQAPFSYPLDTTTLANGSHTLQLWAHDTANVTTLSNPVQVSVQNPVAQRGADNLAESSPSASMSSPIQVIYPLSGQVVSGTLEVTGTISKALYAVGSYLLVDGVQTGLRRGPSGPFAYEVDTTQLDAGWHKLQIWANDIANEPVVSNAVSVIVTR